MEGQGAVLLVFLLGAVFEPVRKLNPVKPEFDF